MRPKASRIIWRVVGSRSLLPARKGGGSIVCSFVFTGFECGFVGPSFPRYSSSQMRQNAVDGQSRSHDVAEREKESVTKWDYKIARCGNMGCKQGGGTKHAQAKCHGENGLQGFKSANSSPHRYHQCRSGHNQSR